MEPHQYDIVSASQKTYSAVYVFIRNEREIASHMYVQHTVYDLHLHVRVRFLHNKCLSQQAQMIGISQPQEKKKVN